MATPAHELPRFQLPARIRAGRAAPQGLPESLDLTDRIAGLPGVEVVACRDATSPCRASAYLHEHADIRTLTNPRSLLLCRVDADGIAVYGLDNWARHQVVMRGWGRLLCNRVMLFLPRDYSELETCWSIIRQAYNALTDMSAKTSKRGNAATWLMPKYSRTTLQ